MKKLLTILTGASLALGGAIALGAFGEKKVEKASALSVVEQTVTSNFQQLYDDLGGNAAANQYGQISLSNDMSMNLYDSGSHVYNEHYLYFHKGGHTNNMRNYHKQDANYYFQLAYSDAGKIDKNTSYFKISRKTNSFFKIKSITLTLNSTNGNPVIEVGSSWTGEPANELEFTKNSKVYTYTFDSNSYPSEVFIGNIATSGAVEIKSMQIVSTSESAVNTITFDSNDGSYVPNEYLRATDPSYAPTAPSKQTQGETKYEFDKWCSDSELENAFTFGSTINSDMTLYAKWTEKVATKYTVTFHPNNGSENFESQVVEGTKAVEPVAPSKVHETPEKYTYIFHQWCTDPELTTPFDWDSLVESNIDLYAKYNRGYTDPQSGSNEYDLINGVTQEADSWNKDLVSDYVYTSLNSYETFDSGKTMPEIIINFEHTSSTGNNGGIYYHGSTKNNPIMRNAKITFSVVDTENVITYVRVVMENYGSSVAQPISLFANDSAVASDTESSIPNKNDKENRFLQASFTASEKVTSFNFSLKDYAMIKVRYVYIGYATNPDLTSAQTFAANFLSAMRDNDVCGSTQSRWSDNNYERLTDGGDDSVWSTWKDNFESLSESVQEFFKSSDDETITEARNLYLHIITRYSSIAKWGNGPTTSGAYIGMNTILGDNTVNIATVISVIVITIAGASFLIFRKKKHE